MTTQMATETYRFDGMKDGWNRTNRIILKGSTDNPEEWIDLKGHADLSEEQVDDLKAHGVKLTKLNTEDAEKAKKAQVEAVTSAATKRGADQMDPQAVLAAQKMQQESQSPDSASASPGSTEGSGDSSGDNPARSGKGSNAPAGGKS